MEKKSEIVIDKMILLIIFIISLVVIISIFATIGGGLETQEENIGGFFDNFF